MLKKLLLLIGFTFFTFVSSGIGQGISDKCRSFYYEYGVYLIDFGDKEKGLKYLLKSEVYDDNEFKYSKILQAAIELEKEQQFILDYLYKLFFSLGEDVSINDLSEDPIIENYIAENQLSNTVFSLASEARINVRNNLNFLFYNKMKNSLYIDQVNRRRKTRFTEDIDLMVKIDTMNIENLASFFKNTPLPKGSFTLGSTKDRFSLILIHNSRYTYEKTYSTVITLGKRLVELGYLDNRQLLMFHDEHLVNKKQKQKYGEAMARWEGDNKLVFPPIESIEKLDSIRVSNGMLPFKFEMQTVSTYSGEREIIPPPGYIFDEDWINYCDCKLLEN